MKLVKLQCPECHANISIEDGRDIVFCQYCGTKIFIDDEVHRTEHKTEHVYRQVDESRIKEAEAQKDVRIREMELKNEKDKRDNRFTMLFIGAMFLMMFFFTISPDSDEKDTQKAVETGMISAGGAYDYIDKKYTVVEQQFEALGFTNIESMDLDDAGLFKNKKDTVESVMIDGDSAFGPSDYFPPGAKVIIRYH